MNRHHTLEVPVGTVMVGGHHPVSVEAMGRKNPALTEAALREIRRSAREGCQIFRIAVPDRTALEGLKGLHARSPLPLIADIHFNTDLAWEAAKFGLEGVRINPGTLRSHQDYRELIEVMRDAPTILRLGANAGSLPAPLRTKTRVDALFETIVRYLEIPQKMNFHRIILSAKSSGIEETIEVNHRLSDNFSYPLHIGLTEAGEGLEAVIKSTLGVGILLREGIGNTIRISLTAADPVPETRVAQTILQALGLKSGGIDIISCPTCARKNGDVVSLVRKLKKRLSHRQINQQVRIAVMGCEVNGPGEAREADLGLALGRETAIVFSHGNVLMTIPQEQALDVLIGHYNTLFPSGS